MRLFGVIVIVFMMSLSTNAQARKSKPVLLKRIDHSIEDVYESLYAVAEGLNVELSDQTKQVAIRVCSTKSLPIAIVSSKVVSDFADRLMREGISDQRIVFLRYNEGCYKEDQSILFEIWLVPGDSEFPSFAEMRLASNLKRRTLIEYGKYTPLGNFDKKIGPEKVTSENYVEAIKELETLVTKERLYLVSIQFCNANQSKELIENLGKLRQSLKNLAINDTRVFWRKRDHGFCSDFPEITLIKET